MNPWSFFFIGYVFSQPLLFAAKSFRKTGPFSFKKSHLPAFQRQKQRHLKLLYRLYAVKFAGLIR